MDKKSFAELKESFKQMAEHAAGEQKNFRTTTRVRPLKPFTKRDIVNIRSRMKVSQAVFANLLNISVKTVQSWEQGLKIPSGPSLKLLTIAKKHPESLL